MLAAYDAAKAKAVGQETQTMHGRVAEAQFRKWLESFLPKRYGVTSGYIVSSGFGESVKLPHYDVVVYDQIESPVLWVDENPDHSKQGMSRALPVEYVRGVFEVKSAFSTETAKEAMEHLNDVSPFLLGGDVEGERHRRFLSFDFVCSVVFFELRADDAYNAAALDHLASNMVRGFTGGVILRAENQPPHETGLIQMMNGHAPFQSNVGRGKESLYATSGMAVGNSTRYGDEHFLAYLRWSPTFFSQFAFDIIAMMNGTYIPGQLSSMHGYSRAKPTKADGEKPGAA